MKCKTVLSKDKKSGKKSDLSLENDGIQDLFMKNQLI